MDQLPMDLFRECLSVLKRREENCGSWDDGLPACIERAAVLLNVRNNFNFVLLVETAIRSQCQRIVYQLSESQLREIYPKAL